jgi:SAM-dependent methyltransferase
MATQDSLWAAGEAYEPYVGRWSRLVAPGFVRWLEPKPTADWIDVGCGTGELTKAILALASPRSVRGVEPSGAFRSYAEAHVVDERVTFSAGDAQHLPCDDASADYIVSGLVLNFADDAKAAVREFARVARPDGMVAAYVWDYAGGMQMMRYFWDTAVELDPDAMSFDEAARFTICNPDALAALWTGAGLSGVSTLAIDVPTTFRDFDDYWAPFLAGGAPAPRYAMSLSEEGRAALRNRIRERLPAAEDGSIRLTARAWAVTGAR